MRIIGKVSFLVGMVIMGCSKSPAALSEEEFLKILGEAVRHAPYQFKERDWPLLEKKMITYCGQLDEVRAMDAGSSVVIKVEKTYAGEKLPWSLEGKTNSPDLARSHKTGDSVCITGILESYALHAMGEEYWGYVKVLSWEKPVAS